MQPTDEDAGLEGDDSDVHFPDRISSRSLTHPGLPVPIAHQVDSFCALVESHIRTEERQLFVLAQNRMEPAEMAELERQIKAQHR